MLFFDMHRIKGHIRITDEKGNVLVDKSNAIHYENMTIAIAQALIGETDGHIFTMWFGNGGTNVTSTGTLQFLPPPVSDMNADLYQPVYYKIINPFSPLNSDNTKNYMKVAHVNGNLWTDINIHVVLDYNEPSGAPASDNLTTNVKSDFSFDEIGLKSFNSDPTKGRLLTYVNFAPILKSLNRRFTILYTIRIETA